MSGIAWSDVMDALQNWVVLGTGLPEAQVIWTGQGGKPPPFPHAVMSLSGITPIGTDEVVIDQNPLVLADDAVDLFVHGFDTLNVAAHLYLTGDGPVRLTTTGTLPAELALATDYWIIKTGAGTIKLAETRTLALAGTAIAFSDDGTGTTTIVDTAETERVGQEIVHRARGPRRASFTVQLFSESVLDENMPIALLSRAVGYLSLPTTMAEWRDAGIGLGMVGAVGMIGGSAGPGTEPRGVLEIRIFLADEVEEIGTNIRNVEVSGELYEGETLTQEPEFVVETDPAAPA